MSSSMATDAVGLGFRCKQPDPARTGLTLSHHEKSGEQPVATDDRDMPAGAAGGGRDDMPAGPPAPHADNGRLDTDTDTDSGRGSDTDSRPGPGTDSAPGPDNDANLSAATGKQPAPAGKQTRAAGKQTRAAGKQTERGREADQGGREADQARPGSRPGRPRSRSAGMGTMTSSRTCHPGPIHSPRFTRRERRPTGRRQPGTTRRMSPVRSPVPRPTGRARTGSPRTPPGRRPGDLRSRGALRGTHRGTQE